MRRKEFKRSSSIQSHMLAFLTPLELSPPAIEIYANDPKDQIANLKVLTEIGNFEPIKLEVEVL